MPEDNSDKLLLSTQPCNCVSATLKRNQEKYQTLGLRSHTGNHVHMVTVKRMCPPVLGEATGDRVRRMVT